MALFSERVSRKSAETVPSNRITARGADYPTEAKPELTTRLLHEKLSRLTASGLHPSSLSEIESRAVPQWDMEFLPEFPEALPLVQICATAIVYCFDRKRTTM
jgi:hypothetical protein